MFEILYVAMVSALGFSCWQHSIILIRSGKPKVVSNLPNDRIRLKQFVTSTTSVTKRRDVILILFSNYTNFDQSIEKSVNIEDTK